MSLKDVNHFGPGMEGGVLEKKTEERVNSRKKERIPRKGFQMQMAVLASGTAGTASVVQLLLQSDRRVQPEFTFHAGNFGTVAAICRRVQGMPLEIELAASWVDILTLEKIAKGIDDKVDFLTGDSNQLST
jgi:hypothetical protein